MGSPRQSGPTDDPVWAGVWTTHRPWLRTVALARSRDPAAVDEILQEVSLAITRQGGLPEDEGLVAPWLYRVTVRQSLLHRRKLGRRRRLTSRYGTELYGTGACGMGTYATGTYATGLHEAGRGRVSSDPLSWMLREESRRLVRVALGRLSTRDAELLLLKYTEHWSYRELAGRLGLTERGVESRLERARAGLRRELCRVDMEPESSRRQGEPTRVVGERAEKCEVSK